MNKTMHSHTKTIFKSKSFLNIMKNNTKDIIYICLVGTLACSCLLIMDIHTLHYGFLILQIEGQTKFYKISHLKWYIYGFLISQLIMCIIFMHYTCKIVFRQLIFFSSSERQLIFLIRITNYFLI